MTEEQPFDQQRNLSEWKIWISKRVKDVRGEMPLGMLSILSGLSEEHLHKIEAGVLSPSKTSLKSIATALNVPDTMFEKPK